MEQNQKASQPSDTQEISQNTETTTSSLLSRSEYLKKLKNLYLNGTSVVKIAKMMNRSRWAIYLALSECGVDTSLGLRGKKKVETEVDSYLDNEWFSSEIGRSPTKIAEAIGVPVSKVHLCLKTRRGILVSLALKMPFEQILLDSDFIDWHVDPYRMLARFHGKRNNIETEIELSKLDMMAVLKDMQKG